jgi:hypothetical protein
MPGKDGDLIGRLTLRDGRGTEVQMDLTPINAGAIADAALSAVVATAVDIGMGLVNDRITATFPLIEDKTGTEE